MRIQSDDHHERIKESSCPGLSRFEDDPSFVHNGFSQ